MIASILGSIISLQLGAFSVVIETELSGITALPWNLFIGVMQPIHLAIGAVEGIITGLVLSFIYEARPELIWQGHTTKLAKTSKRSFLHSLVVSLLQWLGSYQYSQVPFLMD